MQKSGMVISRRRVVTAALLAVPLAGLGRLALNQDVQAANVAVTIMNFTFQPTPLTVPVGTTVVWTNQDTAPHTATSDPGSAFAFDTGTLQKGQSGSITFTTAGSFPYHCNIHPNMHAMVVVTAGSAPAAPAAPAASAPAPAAPAPAAPAPSVAAPPAPPRTGGGDEAHYARRLGDG
ncbi:MAG: cupredoxin domain-containing protein [Thermomicrobiales bacterium]